MTDMEISVERVVPISAAALYAAWTERFDRWFAQPDSLVMKPEVGIPFFFETEMDGRRHPHYGRFLELVPVERVRMTWMTGDPGTRGAETVVTVRFSETGDGTLVSLTHTGFSDDETRTGHGDAWPMVLEHMETQLLRQD